MAAAIDRETGEIVDEVAAELMDELELSIEEKLLNCGKYLMGEKLEAEKIGLLIHRLAKRMAIHERHADWLLKYMSAHAPQDKKFKLKETGCHIRWVNSERVELEDRLLLMDGETALKGHVDPKFVRTKTSLSIDKVAAKAELKSGKAVDGLRLTSHKTMKVSV